MTSMSMRNGSVVYWRPTPKPLPVLSSDAQENEAKLVLKAYAYNYQDADAWFAVGAQILNASG